MALGITDGSERTGTAGFNLLVRSVASGMQQDAQATASTQETVAASVTNSASTAVPENMLARQFVGGADEPSRYVKATLTTLKMDAKVQNAADKQTSSLLDQMKAYSVLSSSSPYGFEESKYISAGRDKRRAERLAEQERGVNTMDGHKKLLKDLREDLETAAEEATAPANSTDAQTSTDTAGSTPAPQAAEASAEQDTAAPTPSIDIVV